MSASINALIAQGGRPIGADVPEIANMLNQRAQQTLQNNRLATQDQYAAEEHAQKADAYNREKTDRDALQTNGESSRLLQIKDPNQFVTTLQAMPHVVEGLQKAGVNLNDLNAVRSHVQAVYQATAAHLNQAQPKPQEVAPGASLVQQGQNPGDPYSTLFTAPKEVDPLAQGRLTEEVRHNKADEAHAAAALSASNAERKTNKLPSGYELDPNKIGALRPIAGGPADPSRVKNGGTIADRMNPTMLASVKLDIAETRNALDKIKGLTTDTSGAFFSVEHAGPLASLFHRAATPEQMQNYDAYANRLAVAIASMQSMGRGQISDAKVSEARKLVPAPGDKKSTINVKLGQIRRIADLAEQTLGQAGSSQTNPIADAVDETGGDTSGLRANASGGTAVVKSDADYAKLPSGSTYTAPDGSVRTKR